MEENSLLNFPKSTEFNKRIPKQKFYENIAVTPAMKKAFVEQSVFSEGNTYVAYDAACPVEASRNVSVEVLEDGLGTAECPKCHTQYNLSSGGFPTGEGTEYLKHYKVTVSGTSLQVRN